MLRWLFQLALAICIGAYLAPKAVAQSQPNTAVVPTPPSAPDMSGWNRVGELRDGQRIIVSTGSGFPIHCVFRGTSDHSLFCDTGNLLLGFYRREIARDEVTWLRTDNYPRDRGIVMGVLGGAGVVLGAASPATPDNGALRGINAILLGSFGAGVGYVAAIPIAFVMPGKTIYALPRPPRAGHPRSPLKKRPAQPAEAAPTQP
jgi:hypothetical protein